MTPAEAMTLLTMRAAFEPNASNTPADANAWSRVLPDVSLADAQAVMVDHYRESTYPVRPAHILDLVRALRSRRRAAWEASNELEPAPPFDADQVQESIHWQRAFRAGIGDGLTTAQADARACRLLGVTRTPEVLTTRPVGAITAQVASTTIPTYKEPK